MNFLVIVLLFVVFLQTRIMDLRRAIICLSVQSAVIALACFISGIAHGEGIHIYAPGLLTIIVKVLLVPYAMLRLVSKLADERESFQRSMLIIQLPKCSFSGSELSYC